MDRRDEQAAKTRQRIVESTLALHSKHGVLGTSWKDIAAAADVSVGTVYKHFPSLEELLPACGALMMERFRPPQPEEAERLVGPSIDPAKRLSGVVEAVFGFYDRAGPAAEIDPRERQLPAIAEWEAYWMATLNGFVELALAPLRPTARTVAYATALLDQRSFAALASRGIDAAEAAIEVARLIINLAGANQPAQDHKQRSKP